MEFRNLTPFSVMQYAMDDKHNERHCVVAMKTGFRLKQDENDQYQPQLMENPPLPMLLDTLEINTDTLTVALTWRFLLPGNTPPIRVLEARYRTGRA
ncbi:TPA: hypothetical protein JGU28_004730 [Salmonella enterica]|nr:hypothetical protein [Salmonella enterica]